MPVTGTPAIFLDRDGVLNELVLNPGTGRYESPLAAEDVRVPPAVLEALKMLRNTGYLLVVVSNQPNLAKGKSTYRELESVHDRLAAILVEGGVTPTEWCYCLHHPQAVVPELRIVCDCRKPATGLVRAAAHRHGIDLRRSWFIGDSDADVLCGRNAGCRTALLENPRSADRRSGSVLPDLRASDLAAAVAAILVRST